MDIMVTTTRHPLAANIPSLYNQLMPLTFRYLVSRVDVWTCNGRQVGKPVRKLWTEALTQRDWAESDLRTGDVTLGPSLDSGEQV